MYLQSTRLTLPWNLGQVSSNSSSYTTYQWTPDPYISTVVVVMMVILTLMPAFCSLCYHIFGRKDDITKVIRMNKYNYQEQPTVQPLTLVNVGYFFEEGGRNHQHP